MLSGFPISGAPFSSTGVARVLVAAVGTFTLAGQDAGTTAAFSLSAAHGSYTLSGEAVVFEKGARLTADHGTYTLDGQSTAFGLGYAFSPDTGTFTLTGQDATLTSSRSVALDTGTFALTGQDAGFRADRIITADYGAFTLDGQATAFGKGYAFAPDTGTFTFTGEAATLLPARSITADYGAFSLAGQTADLRKGPLLVAAHGSYTLTGQTADVIYTQSQIGRNKVDPFPSPVNQQGPVDANIVRANDNLLASAFTTHDGNSLIHVQSGPLMLRPAVLPNGGMYVGTDTALIYFYVNGAWITIGDTGQTGRRWGAFQDFTDQSHTAINTAKLITFDTIDTAYGVTIDAGLTNSKITVNQAGVYNFQWSGQFTNADTQIHDVNIWIAKNGTSVLGSNGVVSVPEKHGGVNGHVLPGWNYYVDMAAGDYLQLYWEVTDLDLTLEFLPATAVHPSTASVICTIAKV
jgi:hypothetical protein